MKSRKSSFDITHTKKDLLKSGIPFYQVKPNWTGKHSAKNFQTCFIQKNQNNKQK